MCCAGFGGPEAYTGKDMVTAHTGMNINEAEFIAVCDDVLDALDKCNVGKREKDELLCILYCQTMLQSDVPAYPRWMLESNSRVNSTAICPVNTRTSPYRASLSSPAPTPSRSHRDTKTRTKSVSLFDACRRAT